MRLKSQARFLHLLFTGLAVALALLLSSCGGGTTTAGTGGSGIGGTGITRVAGNVSEVVAAADPAGSEVGARNLLAALARWVSSPVNAQSSSLQGIRVSGGGLSTLTDGKGDFVLEGVTPGPDFTLAFSFPDEQQDIVLPIGDVPEGADVQVQNVVLNKGRGTAAAAAIEVRNNPAGRPDSPGKSGEAGRPEDTGKPDQPGNSGNAPNEGNNGSDAQDKQGGGNPND